MTPPPDPLRALLAAVARGEIAVADAAARLHDPRLLTSDIGCASVDHGRAARCGFPEVVYCEHKTPADVAAIAAEILSRAPRVLLTRAGRAHGDAVARAIPAARYDELARCITIDPEPLPRRGRVAVVSAGTADQPAAAEACATLAVMGVAVDAHRDVGVAGIHRLFERLARIRAADAIVAVAGMEGALPSVLAGLVDRPVIALPTSVGYGTGVGGLVALATMLNSCAAGVGVVNIDNGFGAAYLAAQIASRAPEPSPP